MIDHVGFEVSDLEQSARFYNAVIYALGARRMFESAHAIAYGTDGPDLWIVVRGRRPGPGYGHVALHASGKAAVDAAHAAGLAAGGRDGGAPAPRAFGPPNYYSGYLVDPDGAWLELVSGSH